MNDGQVGEELHGTWFGEALLAFVPASAFDRESVDVAPILRRGVDFSMMCPLDVAVDERDFVEFYGMLAAKVYNQGCD
jgi:hypothetical protein